MPSTTSTLRFKATTGADSIADALVDAIFHGDSEIVVHIRQTADLNAIDNEIAACQHIPTFGGRTHRPMLPTPSNEPFRNLVCQFQPHRINVYQGKPSLIQSFDLQ